MPLTVAEVQEEIGGHLVEISELFKPGVKLTIVCRHPGIPGGEADVLLTDDDLDLACAAIQRLKGQQKREPLRDEILATGAAD